MADHHLEAPPSMGVDSRKLGMWIFLASEVMFFTSLIAAFIAFKTRAVGALEGAELLKASVPLVALNTFILLVSSYTVVMALDALQRHETQERFVLFLLLSLALGVTFVSIQAVEWTSLLREGLSPDGSILGTAFFVLTGFHGLHVIVGIIWMLYVVALSFRGFYTPQNYMAFELFGLYWHFVDVVWIILFTLIYLTN